MTRFVYLLIAIIIVVLGLSGAWVFAANTIKSEISNGFAVQTDAGRTVSCGDLSVTGFPFRFDVTCTSASFSQLDTTFTLPELKATVLVYRPTHMLVFAKGPMHITDAFTGTNQTVTWHNLRGSVRSNGWQFARLSIEGDGIDYVDNLVGETRLAAFEHLELHILESDNIQDGSEDLVREVHNLEAFMAISAAQLPLLDIEAANMRLEARILDMPNDVRAWTLSNILANWQNSINPLQLQSLEAQDLQSSLSANGQFGITPQGRLNGALDLFTKNVAERLENFVPQPMQQLVFGLPDNEGGLYQSYRILHGVVLAGNLPVWSIPAFN